MNQQYKDDPAYRDFYWTTLGVNLKADNPTREEQALYEQRQIDVLKQTALELALAGVTGVAASLAVKRVGAIQGALVNAQAKRQETIDGNRARLVPMLP